MTASRLRFYISGPCWPISAERGAWPHLENSFQQPDVYRIVVDDKNGQRFTGSHLCPLEQFLYLFYTDGLIERYGTGQRRREDCLVNFIEACVETRDLPGGSAMCEIVNALCPDERTLQDDVLLLGLDLYAGFTIDLNEVFLEQRHSHSYGEIEDMNATFEVRNVSDHLSILFSSALEKIDAVSRETEKFLSHLGIQEKAFRILLSMREALTNMILHGNQEDTQKMVHYRVHVEEGDLVIEVKDEGAGFD